MAFSNTWDNTAPPDTELANLLGQNIRDLKLDIQQRMAAFAIGLLANRPTPEAGFGATSGGVLYMAYDTEQIFYWNGATWVDVSASFLGGAGAWSGMVTTQNGFVLGNSTPTQLITTVTLPSAPIGHGYRIKYQIDGNTGGCTNPIGHIITVNGSNLVSSQAVPIAALHAGMFEIIHINMGVLGLNSVYLEPSFDVTSGSTPSLQNYFSPSAYGLNVGSPAPGGTYNLTCNGLGGMNHKVYYTLFVEKV